MKFKKSLNNFNMKKIIYSLVLILSITNSIFASKCLAQSPCWQWAKSAGGNSDDFTCSSAVDAAGNVYVCGYYYSSTITFGTTTLTNANSGGSTADMFLSKYDTHGNLLWAKNAGGTGEEVAISVAVDAIGSIYIAGYFNSPNITFGSITLNNGDNTGSTADIFYVKYDSNGNVIWAKSAGGTDDDDIASSVVVDNSGSVYVSGYIASTSITFGSITLTNTGNRDLFLAKFDTNGNVEWANSPDANNCMSNTTTVDDSGNVYVAGEFINSLTMGFTTLTSVNSGNYDLFLAKYNPSGSVAWAKSASNNSNNDAINSVCTGRGEQSKFQII